MNKKNMAIVSVKFLRAFGLNKPYDIRKDDIFDFVVYVEYKTTEDVINELIKKMKDRFGWDFEYKKDFEIFECDM